MKRPARVAVITLCVIVGIVIVMTVAVRLILTRDRLVALVVPRIEKRIGATIEIGDIGVKFPFGFGVDVRDLVFSKVLPDSSALSVRTERVTVKASLLSLIRRRPEIDGIGVSNGTVDVTGMKRGPDVRLTGLGANLSVKPAGERFLVSARGSIESLDLLRPEIQKSASIRGITMEGRILGDRAFNSLLVEEMIVSWADLLTVRLGGEVTDLRGERLMALSAESRDIKVAPLFETVRALHLEDLSYLMRASGIGRELPVAVTGGVLGFDAKIQGSALKPAMLAVAGGIDLDGVEMKHAKLESPVRAGGKILFTEAGARSDGLSITFGKSSANVGFEVAITPVEHEITSIAFDASAALDVSELAALGEEKDVKASGTVRAAVKGSGRPVMLAGLFPVGKKVPAAAIATAWRNVKLAGNVKLDGVAASTPEGPFALSGLGGDIALNGGNVERMKVGFSLNGSPFTAEGSMQGVMPALAEIASNVDPKNPPRDLGVFLDSVKNVPTVTVNVAGRSIDVRPFEEKAARKKGAGPAGGPGAAKPKPQALPAANPLVPVMLLNTTFAAHVDSIIATKAVLTAVDARGVVERGKLRIDPVTMDYAGGKGRASCDVDLRNPERVQTKLDISFEGIDAGRALERVSGAARFIEGTFSFKTDGSFFVAPGTDPLTTLKAAGSANSKSGRINAPQFISPLAQTLGLDLTRFERFDFSDWVGSFAVENGRLSTDDWVIRSKSGSWGIRGSFGFDGTLDYAAKLVIPPEVQAEMKDLSKFRDLVDLFRDERGNLVLDFNIGGEAKSPKVELDQTRAKEKAGDKLMDELKKKAKGYFNK